MAAVTYTAAKIAPVFPDKAVIRTYIAGVTITKGQPVYIIAASGLLGLADANAGAEQEQFRGIALNGGGAGQAIDVLQDGEVYGFTLSGNYNTPVYVANNVGEYEDVAAGGGGGVTVIVGRVVPLADKDATKVLRVFTNWSTAWS